MAILKKILYLLPAVLFSGCYEDFTPKVDVEPVLCLNSIIEAGKPIEVSVTHTWLYTDVASSENHDVDDALVTVYVNGKEASADYLACEGDHIRIEAQSKRYGEAHAEVTVPVAVQPAAVKWTATPTDIWEGETPGWEMNADISFNLSAELTLADPAGVENYYQFSYSGYTGNLADEDDGEGLYIGRISVKLKTGTLEYDMEPIFGEHIGVFEAASGVDSDGFQFFTDRQFSGKSYTLHLVFSDMCYEVASQDFDDSLLDCGVVFTLGSVSKSYYNWANYNWQVYEGIIGDMGDAGLADPVWAYSNVSTGAGIVAARSVRSISLNLRPFLEQYFPK